MNTLDRLLDRYHQYERMMPASVRKALDASCRHEKLLARVGRNITLPGELGFHHGTFPSQSGSNDLGMPDSPSFSASGGASSILSGSPQVKNLLPLKTREERESAVDQYLADVERATGRKMTRKDFWSLAGYTDATEFQRWQRCDPKCTKKAERIFAGILRNRPHLEVD